MSQRLTQFRFVSALAVVLFAKPLHAESALSPQTRQALTDAADQTTKDSAVSPVQVSASDQPGYLRSSSGPSQNTSLYTYTTFQLQETKAQFSLGPAFLFLKGRTKDEFGFALRYRISPAAWPISDERPWHVGPLPIALSLEGGAIVPSNNIFTTVNQFSPTVTDEGTVRFEYQTHLSLIDELPHGHQSWVIPEVGGGVALIATKFTDYSYNQFGNYFWQETAKTSLEPYAQAGLHFFPDHFFSLLVEGSYMKIPAQKGFDVTPGFANVPPEHITHLDFPTSAWIVEAKIQMKLVLPTPVHAPMLPQLMPPWLLASYSTDPISPWVASIDVQKKFNEPGEPPVGNVFFQYKNRWVKKVEIIGDFNDWTPQRMIRDRSGVWVSVKDLPAGKFRYNYLIDGHKEIKDPWNKNVDAGSRENGSSLVVIQ